MPEHPEHTNNTHRPAKSFFDKLAALISPEPDSPTELLKILHEAYQRKLIDSECLSMIEGVFTVYEQSVRDIMIPRRQMVVVDITRPIEEWIDNVIANGHSRFPAVDGDPEKIVGIIHAKDLLRSRQKGFSVREHLRTAVFIPESKRLNVLLKDFRNTRNHMAIVIDEFGSISGLVTIEDVLEQIVGDIEDEFDDTGENKITRISAPKGISRWRLPALTDIEVFNTTTNSKLENNRVDTIGGYVSDHIGHIPHKGESFDLEGMHFEVLRANNHQLLTLQVEKKSDSNGASIECL